MAIIQHWTEQTGFARWLLTTLLSDVTDEEAAQPAGPGLPSLAWHVGHIAITNAGCYLGMGKNDWSGLEESWIERFKLGATLPEDPTTLPALSEIVPEMDRWNDRISAFVGQLADGDLDAELECRERGLVPDQVRTLKDLVRFLPMHEAYHIGEIGLQRRRLGKPRLM